MSQTTHRNTLRTKALTMLAALLTAAAALFLPHAAAVAQKSPVAKHKVAIQVDDSNPATMNLALNNVQNIFSYYKQKGEAVDVELVAYGPGLHMYRADTSPVKDRLAKMALEYPKLKLSACGNTQANMSKAEKKDIKLISEATVVPSGVITLLELQEKGYSYIRP